MKKNFDLLNMDDHLAFEELANEFIKNLPADNQIHMGISASLKQMKEFLEMLRNPDVSGFELQKKLNLYFLGKAIAEMAFAIADTMEKAASLTEGPAEIPFED